MATKKTTRKTKKASSKVIDKSIKNDRSIELRGSVDLTAKTVSEIQRALLFQSIAKNGDTSSLKFYLGPAESSHYRLQDQAALADTMLLVSSPVDVIVRSGLEADGLKTFLSATGKRYMLAGASLHMGIVTNASPYGKNKASQVRRQLFNDYMTDLQTLVMMKTGENSRKKVYEDLVSAKGFSSIEALYYGTKGLIDGILVGHSHVITRADLDAFFAKKRWTKAKIEEFNKHYINVYQLPTRALSKLAPQSIPKGTTSFYESLKKDDTDKDKGKKKKGKTKKATTPLFFMGDKKVEKLPLLTRATDDKPDKRMMAEQPHKLNNGILDDDVIFFNDGFQDTSAEQIGDALLALEHKKLSQRHKKSHIKILENSPGGSVWSGQELRSLIKSLLVPVDVIVQGMGASCGSWLLCSATGNRLATPNARIMFHEAANALNRQTPHDHYNEMHDGLDQATLDYIAIVAEATGRKFDDVLIDFDHDVWLNPVESLFYGPKGLLDGILVGHNQVITRDDVEKYLIKQLGSKTKVAAYTNAKILEKRDPRLGMEWRPEKHNETDPFDNPLTTIAAVTQQSARSLTSKTQFKGSAPGTDPKRTIDFFNVVCDDSD